LVRPENAVPSDFWPCTMIPTQRKMRWLRLWLGVFPGRVLGVLTIHPPSMESGMHGRSQMPVPEWSCGLAFGFTAVPGCGLSAEVCAVACLLHRHLYEEALTCLAARVLRCAYAGA
jgi:hypothetical protein